MARRSASTAQRAIKVCLHASGGERAPETVGAAGPAAQASCAGVASAVQAAF